VALLCCAHQLIEDLFFAQQPVGDESSQVEGRTINGVVLVSVGGVDDSFAFVLHRLEGVPAVGVRGGHVDIGGKSRADRLLGTVLLGDQVQEPLGGVDRVHVPANLVGSLSGDGRGNDDHPALATDVDPHGQRSTGVGDLHAFGKLVVVVHPPGTGLDGVGLLKGLVLGFELFQLGVPVVVGVDVEDEHPGFGAGDKTDIGGSVSLSGICQCGKTLFGGLRGPAAVHRVLAGGGAVRSLVAGAD